MTSAASPFSYDVIVAGLLLLAALALGLLHHQRRQQRVLAALRRQLRRNQSARAEAERCLAHSRAELARQPAREQALRDAERRRMARELHDDLGQHLLALTLAIPTLDERAPTLRADTGQIEAHLRLTMRTLRAVVSDVLPEALESGLRPAAEPQLAQLAQLTQLTRLVSIAGHLQAGPDVVDRDGSRHIGAARYRARQESLRNSVRHTRASEARNDAITF